MLFRLAGEGVPIGKPEIGVRPLHSDCMVLCAVEVYRYWEVVGIELDVGDPVGVGGEVGGDEGQFRRAGVAVGGESGWMWLVKES